MAGFRDTVTNQRLTRALFLEESYMDRTYVLYTLKNHDHEGYKSLYQLYINEEDPTEGRFANKYFEDYDHWMAVSEAPWLKKHISKWRKELDVRLRSRALSEILSVANNPDHKSSYEANKYILNGNWKSNSEAKKGRPSKEEITRQAEELFRATQDTNDDYLRVINNEN